MKKVYLIATIAALFTAIAVYFFANGIKQNLENQGEPNVLVVTAKTDLPENTVLKEDMLILKEIPSKAVLTGANTNILDVKSKILKYPVIAGEQITQSKVETPGDKAVTGLSAKLVKDQRAITIPVSSEDVGVAGFIRSGDRIDFISVQTENGVSKTKILFKNIQVLMVSNNSANASGGKIMDYSTLTLCVDSDLAVKISDMVGSKPYRIALRPLVNKDTSLQQDAASVTNTGTTEVATVAPSSTATAQP